MLKKYFTSNMQISDVIQQALEQRVSITVKTL